MGLIFQQSHANVPAQLREKKNEIQVLLEIIKALKLLNVDQRLNQQQQEENKKQERVKKEKRTEPFFGSRTSGVTLGSSHGSTQK